MHQKIKKDLPLRRFGNAFSRQNPIHNKQLQPFIGLLSKKKMRVLPKSWIYPKSRLYFVLEERDLKKSPRVNRGHFFKKPLNSYSFRVGFPFFLFTSSTKLLKPSASLFYSQRIKLPNIAKGNCCNLSGLKKTNKIRSLGNPTKCTYINSKSMYNIIFENSFSSMYSCFKKKSPQFSTFFIKAKSKVSQHKILFSKIQVDPKKTYSHVEKTTLEPTKTNIGLKGQKKIEYSLDSYNRSNQDTCLLHRPAVFEGQWVQSGDLLADCAASVGGELSLGQNILIAYMPWEGYNYEDAILISERLVYDDLYTSVHIEKYEMETRETKLGKEEITREIPDISESDIDHLDQYGIAKIGSWVEEGDILVGKTTPINKKNQSPYQKLLYTILEKDLLAVRDSSLRAPKGIRAKIIKVQLLKNSKSISLYYQKPSKNNIVINHYISKKTKSTNKDKVAIQMDPYRTKRFTDNNILVKRANLVPFISKTNKTLQSKNWSLKKNLGILCSEKTIPFINFANKKSFYSQIYNRTEKTIESIDLNKKGWTKSTNWPISQLGMGSTKADPILESNKSHFYKSSQIENKLVKSTLFTSKAYNTNFVSNQDRKNLKTKKTKKTSIWIRSIEVQRHRGELSKSLFSSGLQVHLYLAEKRKVQVGDKLAGRHGNKGIISQILPREDMPYLPDGTPIDMVLNPLGVPSRMNVGQIYECLLGLAGKYLGENYKVFPFDEIYGPEASRSFVYSKLNEARLKTGLNWLFEPNTPGKIRLYDGRTGDCFDQAITVGQAYILRLVHMVDDKIHSRATGPYSLVTQQPLRGRSKQGGQRLGEMEVWALEGYGAAFTLLEMLTIKSDDMTGRITLWSNLILNRDISIGTPESFKVLICELQALCLDIGLYRLHQPSLRSKRHFIHKESLGTIENLMTLK